MSNQQTNSFLSDVQLARRYSVNRVTIWRWLKERPGFPRPVALSQRVRRWRLEEIQDWESALDEAGAS